MAIIDLDDQEWAQLMAQLTQAPWHIANPLLMKIGEQLRQQQASANARTTATATGNSRDAALNPS